MISDIYKKLIKKAIASSASNPSRFLHLKEFFCSKNKLPHPTNADIRELYNEMVKRKEIKESKMLEKAMLSRAIRTRSGVAIVAVLTKPYPCPGKCIFCPTEKNIPKSYLSNEPAVMRAIMNKFNPYNQVRNRIKALELNGHETDKIELIVMGGTFSCLTKNYQKKFITACFRACNDYEKSVGCRLSANETGISNVGIDEDLLKQQTKNEKAKRRIVGLTLETRPDYINEKEILNFRNLGCTRVEMGVQSIFDPVLKLNKRGHLVKDTIKATKLLKDAGFKINYHMMPGLYGSNGTAKDIFKDTFKDIQVFERLFSNSDFRPDMLKIYPTIITKNSKLYRLWKKGKYKAMTDRQFENLVIKIKNEIIPPYVRIQRLVRDVPLTSIEAGPKISNLRQLVAKKVNCKCIRCREIKGEYSSKNKFFLDRIDYDASDGREIFLQFVDHDSKLYALLRMRISDDNNKGHFISALRNSAIIREVHTYGKLAPINKKDRKSPQHIGLGKKLIGEAEKIAKKEFGISKIVIISGVGVRQYYRKLGYRLQNSYMTKKL